MSKSVHAVIAVVAAVLIMGSMRSFGNPVRGVGDDLILGLFSLAVLGVFIAIGWFAYSSLPGGSGGSGGGGGVSPADFAALKTSVDTGFTNVQTRIDAVKGDTDHTRKAVDDVKVVVDRMDKLLAAWAPELKDLKATIAGLLSPIGKGVDDIKKLTEELIDWKNKTWKKFSDDITLAVSQVFDKVKTVDVDLTALTGAVKKLDLDQQGVAKVVDEIKKEQGVLQKSVTDGFSALPASVAKEVQNGLNTMQAALSGQIGTIATNQAAMQGMLSGFVTTFSAWQSSVNATLASLPASTASAIKGDLDAVRIAIKAETDGIRTDMTRELGGLASKQTSVQEALVRLTDAQDKMRKRLKKALAALPLDLQQVMEAQLQRVEGVFTKNIQDLTAAQKVTSGEVAGLAAAAQGAQAAILAQLEQNRQALQGEFTRQLTGIQTIIHDEIEPVSVEMRAINGRIGQVLGQVNAQFASLNQLRYEEGARFVETQRRIAAVQVLLEKVEKEGAKASALDEVDNNVALILDWCGQHGPRVEQLGGQLPALNPLLDELRGLVDKLQKKKKEAQEKTERVIKTQQGLIIQVAPRYNFRQWLFEAQAGVFYVGLLLLKAQMQSVNLDGKKELIRKIMPVLQEKQKELCADTDSSKWEMQRIERRQARVGESMPQKLLDEQEVLSGLCRPNGRLAESLKALEDSATAARSTVKGIEALLDSLIHDKAFREVAKLERGVVEKELNARLGFK